MTPALAPDPGGHLAELERPPAPKLLAIDWATTPVNSDADAQALWQRIAPTGEDWEAKLAEIPTDPPVARALAIALLRDGNFTCAAPPAGSCARAPLDVPPPAPTATLTDPCLRRMLALWALDQVEVPGDLPRIEDALRALAAIPPPESELTHRALQVPSESDQNLRLELRAIAWAAGQHDVVNAALGGLDDAHALDAATRLHIDGAFELLTPEGPAGRAAFLGAITDEKLAIATRVEAMAELVAADADKLAPDVRHALVGAARSPECGVAAAAARMLDQQGEHGFVPRRPHVRKPEPMLRAICVLASYEHLQRADETSLFASYLPPRGLELVKVAYDPYGDVDTDGDGDPHTERTIDLVARDEAVLPELDDLIRALHHCTGTTCRSDDREFRFTFKPGGDGELLIRRLEVIELPPCADKRTTSVP